MYQLELLHPDWFARRPYRTLTGLYASLERAQASVPCCGAWWVERELIVGKYRFPMWEMTVGKSGAWWRITVENSNGGNPALNGVN